MLMKKIDIYILNNFLSKFLSIMISFLVIFFAVDIIDKLDNFSKYKISNQEIINYYFYTLPWYVSLALPMTLLLSTIFCFSILQKNNEITALKSSGLSIKRISIPIIIAGLLFSLFSFIFDNSIVINQLTKRNEIEKKLKPNRKVNLSRKNNIYYHIDDTFLGIKRFNYFNNTARNVSIQKASGSDIEYRIDAEKMIWKNDENKWSLINFEMRKWINNKIYHYSSLDTLLAIKDINPEIIKKDNINPEDMSYWQLSSFIKKLKNKGLNYARWSVNKHFKTAFACSPLIMILFGIALSIQSPRSSSTNGIGLSIIVIFMYYLLIKFGQSLGYNNIINPFLSVWMVNIIFLSIGTYLFAKSRT